MSNELIKITTKENGQRLVSARELHEGLEIKTRFNDWFKRMCEYGFEENQDFATITQKRVTAQGNETTFTDYAISVDMAKEISMIQRNDLGKKFRQYFIECEKQLSEVQNKANLLLSIYNGGQEGVIAAKQLTEIEVKEATTPLLAKIEEDKPLVEFSKQVSESVNTIDVGQFAKLVKDENINIGRNKLFDWLRKNKYLMKDNTPYQDKVNQGLFEIKEYTYKTTYGVKTGLKCLITGKGQIYLIEKLRKEFNN